uniref:Uncharacterized protein n=1 Tax=Sphenodon punctatus TaxID=8508 RepID=A0A8D0HIE1_SPHPU
MTGCGYIPSCPAPLAANCAVPLNNLAPLCGDGYGYGYGGLGLGLGLGGRFAGGVSALAGPLPGVNTSCVSQIPASEVVIQPPPPCFCITIPGPILSASCDPVAVGGNTPCARGSYGSSGYGVCRPC